MNRVKHRVRVSENPWPMFKHDPQHTGRSPYLGAQEAKLKWKYATDGLAYSSPAIGVDGTIYVGGGEYLHAVNPDGTLKWRYKTEDAISSSSPAIGADGTIYVGSWDVYLCAIG
ncbi:MAG: PQQ-binding-like beta-propeller repeat protein [Thermoproteota archaeon]